MAFNPFHAFRKHQKVLFAGLTILCMFTFVAMSGVSTGGDLFSQLVPLFGGQSRGKMEVANLYGRSIDQQEIVLLRQQRRLANEFMSIATQNAQENLTADIIKTVPEFDKALQDQLQTLTLYRRFAAQMGRLPEFDSQLNMMTSRLRNLQASLLNEKKDASAKKIGALMNAYQREVLQNQNAGLEGESGLYFGGSLTLDGLLDFLIWKHQADALGIQLKTEDVKLAISMETWDALPGEDANKILNYLNSRESRISPSHLLSILNDEFRVRLARAAFTGFDPDGAIRTPAFVTPAELWEYYRKNRTMVSVTMLPVPVSKFVAQVKEQPTTDELKELFEKYKDVESAPFRATPGFKQPRRVRVEWIEASTDAGATRKAARQILMSLLAGAVGQPLQGPALLIPILNEYQYNKSRLAIPGLTDPGFGLAFYSYGDQRRADAAANLVGQVAGVFATGGSPLSPIVGAQSGAVLRQSKAMAKAVEQEAHNRVPTAVGFLAPGFVANPIARAVTLSALSDPDAWTEQYLPLDVVQTEIVAKVEDNLSKDLVNNALDDFKKELDKHKTQRDQFVKDEAKRRGWKFGASERWDDLYDVASDAGLKPLREVYQKSNGQLDPKNKQFAERFFSDAFGGQQPKIYAPEQLGADGNIFLYWKTADENARALSFTDALPQVEKAWRLEKARALAEAEAKNIESEAKADALKHLPAQAKKTGANMIDVNAVAQLRRKPVARAGLGDDYEFYQVPEDKIEYPAGDFVSQVLEMKNPGETRILSNAPKDAYYIAALTLRVEPSVHEFAKDTSTLAFQFESALLGRLESERRVEYIRGVLDQLRAQAHLRIEEDRRSMVSERGSD